MNFMKSVHEKSPARAESWITLPSASVLSRGDTIAQVTAQLLVVLTAEPGENILYESYNEMPFDVGKQWEVGVPLFGFFTCEFQVRGPRQLSMRDTSLVSLVPANRPPPLDPADPTGLRLAGAADTAGAEDAAAGQGPVEVDP